MQKGHSTGNTMTTMKGPTMAGAFVLVPQYIIGSEIKAYMLTGKNEFDIFANSI